MPGFGVLPRRGIDHHELFQFADAFEQGSSTNEDPLPEAPRTTAKQGKASVPQFPPGIPSPSESPFLFPRVEGLYHPCPFFKSGHYC